MTLEELAKAKGFSVEELTRFHVRDDLFGERVEIPYFDASGDEYERIRLRFSDRKFSWSAGDEPIHLYGLWKPVPWDKPLIVCEGESDCWSLWLNHVPAIGVPGASNYKLLHGSMFADVKTVAITEEPDEAGKSFAFDCAQQLYATGYKGEVVTIRFAPNKDARQAYNNEPAMLAHFYDGYVWRRRTPIAKAAPVHGPRIYTYAELLALPPEEHHWRIDGIVHEEGLVIVVARPKVGKSTLLRNLTLSLVRGEPFLERATKQCSVMWLALEESKADVMEHFGKLGIRADDAIGFHFGDPPQKSLAWLNEVAEGYGAIVIDTLGKFFPQLQNFNDYGEVNRALRPMERFAHDTHRTILFAHHAGWSGEVRAQGSTAIAAAADSMLLLNEYSALRRSLSSVQRGGNPFDKAVLLFERESNRITLGTGIHENAIGNQEQHIENLFAGEPLTREQILRGGNTANRREALAAMIRNGALVVVSGAGTKGNPLRYLPKSQAGNRSSVVIPFPEIPGRPSADPERPPISRMDLALPQNGPAITIVGALSVTNVTPCAVCGEVRAAYRLSDQRAWCAVCYDAGHRPAST